MIKNRHCTVLKMIKMVNFILFIFRKSERRGVRERQKRRFVVARVCAFIQGLLLVCVLTRVGTHDLGVPG